MMQKRPKDCLKYNFIKRFYILQNQIFVFKKKKMIKLVKPINYREIAANIPSN